MKQVNGRRLINLNANESDGIDGDAYSDDPLEFVVLDGGAGNDVLSGRGRRGTGAPYPNFLNLIGGENADIVFGGPAADMLRAEIGLCPECPGKDLLNGRGGNDEIFGSIGADKLVGGKGADTMEGADGGDIMNGKRGNDKLFGQGGSDAMDGGLDTDKCRGGPGIDSRARCET